MRIQTVKRIEGPTAIRRELDPDFYERLDDPESDKEFITSITNRTILAISEHRVEHFANSPDYDFNNNSYSRSDFEDVDTLDSLGMRIKSEWGMRMSDKRYNVHCA